MTDIIGSIIKHIPNVVTSRIINLDERKKTHLEDIKKDVLEPMHHNLTTVYLELLEMKFGIVCVADSFDGEKMAYKLVSSLEEDPLADHMRVERDWIKKVNKNLYEDVKEHHFKDLITEWESFNTELRDYAGLWVQHSEMVFRRITSEIDVPFGPSIEPREDVMDAHELAKFVTNKIYGSYPRFSLILNKNKIVNHSRVILESTEEKAQAGMELIESLLKDDSLREEHSEEHDRLLKKARSLESKIDRRIKSYTPLENCDYVCD